MDTTPDALIQLHDKMRSDASGMTGLWNECGRMCLTRRLSSLTSAINRTADVTTTFTPYDAALLNAAAVKANKALAAGCAAWITPAEQPWFAWEPVEGFKTDAVRMWLAECATIARLYLGASNFYTKVHELYLDRNTFGTGCMMAEQGKSTALNFRVFDAGSYVIADNEEGNADMLFREHPMSARQAKEKFGEGKLSARVKSQLESKPTEISRYLQAIYPRPVEQQDSEAGPAQMAIASCWIDLSEKMEVMKSGFPEMPIFVNRYLRWSEFSPWGVSPAMEALAEIRGLNYIELLVAQQAEQTVWPRIIIPQGYTGVPDLRAGGQTMGGLTKDQSPYEWATAGRMQEAMTMMERKEANINDLFHKSLFDQFANIEREITAAEVHAREAEKVANFSPAFYQLTTELINPVMERVFMLLFRVNKFPPPPQEALYRDAAGNLKLAFPQTVQTSRMALAMQAMKGTAFANMMGRFTPMQEMGIPVFDNVDSDEIMKDLTVGDGAPKAWFKESEVVDAMRQSRAQAQQAAQQSEMAMQAMKSKPLVDAGLKAGGLTNPDQQRVA